MSVRLKQKKQELRNKNGIYEFPSDWLVQFGEQEGEGEDEVITTYEETHWFDKISVTSNSDGTQFAFMNSEKKQYYAYLAPETKSVLQYIAASDEGSFIRN